MSRLGHKRLAVLITIVLALGTFIWRSPEVNQRSVLAQSESGWSKPVMVSTTTVKSWFPDIAVDAVGRAHIVWHSERSKNDESHDLLMYTTWDGETYSEPNDIIYPGVGGNTVRPAIAADGRGKLHLVYRAHTDIRYAQSPADAAWSATSWTSQRYVSEGRSAYYSDIAIDSEGGIHVVWNEQPPNVIEPSTMWFGTLHGVSRLGEAHLGPLSGDSHPGLGDYVVYTMLEDWAGIQWFGTDAGLAWYDGVTMQWLTSSDGLAGNHVFALAEDMDHSLWLGTDRGISHYDQAQPEDERWTTIPLAPELAASPVQAMALDRGGNVWVGTSVGLGVFTGRKWETYHIEDGLASENVTAVVNGRGDVVWMGTDAGLMQFADGQWNHWTTRDGLSGNRVTALALGIQDVLWVGTEAGLSRYDGEAWQSFTTVDGLIDDHITALAVDSERVLWVGTPAGVSLYDGSGWTSYGAEDGLLDPHVTAIVEDRVGNAMCPSCMDVFYRRSVDGGHTWSAPVNLSNSYAGSTKPQVVTDENGGVHVVWEEGEDWYLGDGYPVGAAYRHSADGGTTWSEPFLFTHPDGAPQQITLSTARAGELVAVWRLPVEWPEYSAVYYQVSKDNGATWSEPESIPGILAKDWKSMSLDSCHAASDSAGHVHLLVLGYLSVLDEELSLIYTMWDGQEWSTPYSLYTSADPPEWPKLAVGMGNVLHATWFTRDEAHVWDSERGRYRVWAAARQVDAPLLTPVPTLVSVPTPTASPSVPPALAPTPMPTVPTGSAPPAGIFTDLDDAVRLAIALAPVAGLIAVVLVARRLAG